MHTIRKVVGRSDGKTGCIAKLALNAVKEINGFGFTVTSHRASRGCGQSRSRYLTLVDGKGRSWSLRISDHYRPNSSCHAPHHFDLVSLDGKSGIGEVRCFLIDIACGEAKWWDRDNRPRRPRRKRRPNLKRLTKGRAVR